MKIDLKQLDFIHDMLKEIMLAIEKTFGEQTITSLYRIGDSGVHGTLPLRGLDFRCRNTVKGNEIETWVNERYIYDYKRIGKVCCMYHDVGKGVHIHLQVHPNTKER